MKKTIIRRRKKSGDAQKNNWEDTTSYSQKDKERIPKVWELRLKESYSVVVHRHIYYPGDVWLLSFPPRMINYRLKSKKIEDAKVEAISLAIEYLENILKQLKGG